METKRDLLITEGINARGFGTISKLAMLDRRLTIQAKAIYAYFSSYAGGGSQPFPSVEKILVDLGIGEDTYYKHLAYLKAYGYILVDQRKCGKGKFLSNIYTLSIHPVPVPSLVEKIEKIPGKRKSNKLEKAKKSEKDDKEVINPNNETINNVEKTVCVPSPKISGTVELPPKYPSSEKPCTDNPGTNINNNSYIKNNILLTTTNSNVVVTNEEIRTLKKVIDKTIAGNMNPKIVKRLVVKYDIEKIKYCIEHWAEIVGTQKIKSVESFFVSAITEGYVAQTPGKGSQKSNSCNFEQRLLPEDYEERFFSNFGK